MSDLLRVAEGVNGALSKIEPVRSHLSKASTCVDEALTAFAEPLTDAADAPLVIPPLEEVRTGLTQVTASLTEADGKYRGWLSSLGVAVSAPPSAGTPPTPPSPAPGPSTQPGTWRGGTAAEHARGGGQNIGRLPSPAKRRIREVASVDALSELFQSLSQGATAVDLPSYPGRILRCSDGTLIGYRVKSRTTVEPTIDITTPDGASLKIHVNPRGWSHD